MKKVLIISAAAVLALVSCAKVTDQYVGAPESREIAFSPLSQPATRGANAILDGTFPTDNTMEIACWQSAPATASSYFAKMTFAKDGDVWTGGINPQYWPLSEATLNFFAVSGYGVDNSHIAIENNLATATVSYTAANSYDETTQSDIMYAFNRGSVVQSGNNLTFNGGTNEAGSKVNMVFQHALSQINFQLKADSAAEAEGGTGEITINSITLTGAKYTGTLTLTNTNANTVSETVTTAVSWVADGVVNRTVPNVPTKLATTYAPVAPSNACLLIVPNATSAFTSFTINYTVNGHTYDYTYTPVSTAAAADTKYTFQINFRLHEITVNPSVDPWTESASGDINVF